MSRYYGTVGYAAWVERTPGDWVEEITTRQYYGDFLSISSRSNETENINDDIQIENSISIVADPFAYENFAFIRYATIGHMKWKVRSVEVNRPRLILSLGGVYHEQEGGADTVIPDDPEDSEGIFPTAP